LSKRLVLQQQLRASFLCVLCAYLLFFVLKLLLKHKGHRRLHNGHRELAQQSLGFELVKCRREDCRADAAAFLVAQEAARLPSGSSVVYQS